MTAPRPHLRAERRLWTSGRLLVAGVDEVGMGALCAPVFAAAVVVKPNCHKIPGVRDSKTMTARQRATLVGPIKRRVLAWGIGAASLAEIERLNIYHASHLAMRRALARVGTYDHVLVDGRKIVGFEDQVGPYTSIVDGDASSYAIACASVIAKVTRDRLMSRLASRYPGYGWEHNAGYTTRDHVAALRDLGLTPHHRRTYARIRAMLEGEQLPLDFDAIADDDAADAFDGRAVEGLGGVIEDGAEFAPEPGDDVERFVPEAAGLRLALGITGT